MSAPGFDASLAGKGLGARLTDIEAAMDRLGSFAFSLGEGTPAAPDDPPDDAARHLVLRALSAVSDGLNYRLLSRLVDGDASLVQLAGTIAVSLPAAWERVNDLVQVGVVSRALEGNQVGLTPAGQALVGLVEEIAAAAAQGRKP